MKHKFTTEDGLPTEGTITHTLLTEPRPRIELVEPAPFGWDGYNVRLKAGDIFYRYPLEPRTEYDEGQAYRVGLIQNGAAYLLPWPGSGAVFADRTWFQGRTLSGNVYLYGYTLVARYKGEVKPGSGIDRIDKWAKRYAGS